MAEPETISDVIEKFAASVWPCKSPPFEPGVISSEKLDELRGEEIGVEDFLDYLVETKRVLLLGTCKERDWFQGSHGSGAIVAYSHGGIAIARAVIDTSKCSGFRHLYPPTLGAGLEFRVHGIQQDTIHKSGFVYVLPRTGFLNRPKDSERFTNMRDNPINPFVRVQVLRSDLKYPIIDVSTGKPVN